MADLKITALGANTTPLSTDVTVIVDDPGGTPATQKITLANLALGLGAAWTTWSPSLTNLSGGTLNYAKYQQFGKTVHFKFKYTLGGAGVAGLIGFSPPVTMAADYAATDFLDTTTMFYDLNVTTPYQGNALTTTTTLISLRALHTDGTRGNNEATSSTNPITFATGDIIYCAGTFEAA